MPHGEVEINFKNDSSHLCGVKMDIQRILLSQGKESMWIDTEDSDGKRSGAFKMSVLYVKPHQEPVKPK